MGTKQAGRLPDTALLRACDKSEGAVYGCRFIPGQCW